MVAELLHKETFQSDELTVIEMEYSQNVERLGHWGRLSENEKMVQNEEISGSALLGALTAAFQRLPCSHWLPGPHLLMGCLIFYKLFLVGVLYSQPMNTIWSFLISFCSSFITVHNSSCWTCLVHTHCGFNLLIGPKPVHSINIFREKFYSIVFLWMVKYTFSKFNIHSSLINFLWIEV